MAQLTLMLNSNILQHYKGYELLIKKLDEAVYRYHKSYINVAFDFLAPDEIRVAESYLSDKVPYLIDGGYQDALRKVLIIGEDIEPSDYFVCLRAKFNEKFNKLTHRDVKGAVYNSGFEPEKFGDYWIENGYIYLYVVSELSDYICLSFHQISHCTVHFEQCENQAQVFKFEYSKVNVSSLRLDKITSAIVRKSREKAQALIESSMVNVNYKTIEDCAFMCNNYDILSLRGFGRFQIEEIEQNRRSGNYIVTVKKFV